jgi:hypothetical protein
MSLRDEEPSQEALILAAFGVVEIHAR